MKKTLFLIAIFIFSIGCAQTRRTETITVTIGEWNVENLFDTIDDPGKKDEEFTPEGKKHWTQKRLNVKLNHLARALNLINPDLWGFEEVEHKALIDSIISRMRDKEYGVAYAESPDFRGIDNALIFNKSIFSLKKTDTLRVPLPQNKTTRYILYVQLEDVANNEWNVFVNHWPSRWGGKQKSEPRRISAAQTLKEFLVCNNINRNVIILGDFNDEPDDASIRYCLSAQYDIKDVVRKTDLINLAAEKFLEGEGSLNYRGDWNMLDQIIVSQNLISGNEIKYSGNSFEVVKYDFLVIRNGKYKGNPDRTYAGKKYLGGYSDHFPVAAKFEILK